MIEDQSRYGGQGQGRVRPHETGGPLPATIAMGFPDAHLVGREEKANGVLRLAVGTNRGIEKASKSLMRFDSPFCVERILRACLKEDSDARGKDAKPI